MTIKIAYTIKGKPNKNVKNKKLYIKAHLQTIITMKQYYEDPILHATGAKE